MFLPKDDFFDMQSMDADSEALQTDIQRFIAILGFCLMAIFALVQSIPVTTKVAKTKLEDFKSKFEAQNEVMNNFKKENLTLRTKIDSLREINKSSTRKIEQLDEAEAIINELNKQVDKLLTDKKKMDEDLFAQRRILENRDKEIARLEKEKNTARKLMGKKSKTPNKVQSQKAIKPKPKAKRGTVFESDEVIFELLAAEMIAVFIKVEGVEKPYRAFMRNGKIGFKAENLEQNLYGGVIDEYLTPQQILDEFRNFTTLSKRNKMIIVHLYDGISSKINALQKQENGQFIIKSGGEVKRVPIGKTDD